MLKKLVLFTILTANTLVLGNEANALTSRSAASDYVSESTYNNLYPYMNNTMRTNLNPGTTPSQSNAPINVLTRAKTTNNTPNRNVVPRSTSSTSSTSVARSATTGTNSSTTARRVSARNTSTASTARSGTNTTNTTARSASPTTSSTRRVVARSGTVTNTAMQSTASRNTTRYDGNTSTVRQSSSTAVYTSTNSAVSSARCMADYTECMNDYCEREDTEYNRCYCSSKLAQIDAKYKPAIDNLIKEILTIQNKNYWTEEEMNEYWMEKIGQYTGDNSWANLDAALNIDWSGTESQIRGQQAFAMGHSYCVQHLKNCASIQTNLRDAYRSEIARDCATYESSLQRLKSAAESIVESYK